MLSVVGGHFDLSTREQYHMLLASIKNQSFESKSVKEELLLTMKAYTAYKINYGKNLQFDPFAQNFCKYEICS